MLDRTGSCSRADTWPRGRYYYLALKNAKASASELHLYPDRNHDAIHGYGRCLRPKITNNEVCSWTANAEVFMARLGLIKQHSSPHGAWRWSSDGLGATVGGLERVGAT